MVDLTSQETKYDTSKDSIIIIEHIENIPGGKTLDVTGLPADMKFIVAGHVVIQDNTTKVAKALGVTAGAYVAVPGGHTVIGLTRATVPKDRPFVSVMVRGSVNTVAYGGATNGLVYASDVKTPLTLIRFTED